MLLRLMGLLFILTMGPLFSGKPPQLSPKDTRQKIEEVLRSHVQYHELTPELIQRAFVNYLDELDPIKTYFLKEEIAKWMDPSEELLDETLTELKKDNFSVWENMHKTILPAIERRAQIEKKLLSATLPNPDKSLDFRKIDWANTPQELEDRIFMIRAIQLEAAKKLAQEERFVKRLEKRRLKHEEEIVGDTPKERDRIVLSYALKSISGALDSQTVYFTPAEANQFMVQVQQRLFGIGCQLRDDLNGFSIVRLLEGGPAKECGKIYLKDKIIAVDKEPVVGMEIIEAVELMRGPKGTPVTLTLLREHEDGREETVRVKIIRDEIVLKESRYDFSYEPFGNGVIGILSLHSFYQDATSSSASDLYNSIEKLKSEHNLKGIILDLRNNGGGLLPQAVSVAGLFIKKGIVVSVKDNSGSVQHLRNINGNLAWEGPLCVLTNKVSASASEIVAGTLQDYGRAIVVGDATTYGKGTFQTFTLESANYGKINPKGELKVTRGCYFTVSGKSPQLVGVSADITVPSVYSEMEVGEKYSKYPLENETIPANFEDNLADVPPIHRNKIVRLYKFNLQPILNSYTSFIPILKKNSERRIEQNKNYQVFLKEISKKEGVSDAEENFGQTDLQLQECSSIMKDLILLMQENQSDLVETAS